MGHTGTGPINTSNYGDSPFFVSRQKDNFIQNKQDFEAHWHVFLSNGEEIFDDHGRKDGDYVLPAAWLRLKKYCDYKSIHIKSMYLRFRSHYEHIEPAEGYMFKMGSLGSPGALTRNYFVIGRVIGDKIFVEKWKTPELIVEERDTRDLKDNLEWTILNKV